MLFLLMALAIAAVVYVAFNLMLARWLLAKGETLRMVRRHYRVQQRSVGRFFGARQMQGLSVLTILVLACGLYQLNVAKTIWSFSFTLLCLGCFPIFASVLFFDRVMARIEPKSALVKWGIAVLVGLFAWFIKAAVSDELNTIFPIDPSAMPVALSVGIFLAISGFAAVLVALLALVVEVATIFGFFYRAERRRNSIRGFVMAMLPLSFFIAFYLSGMAFQKIGLSSLRTLLISRIAFEYDFNSKHLCYAIQDGKKVALKEQEKVLFLGATQTLGLAAVATDFPEKPFRQINEAEMEKLYPFGFHSVVCNDPFAPQMLRLPQ